MLKEREQQGPEKEDGEGENERIKYHNILAMSCISFNSRLTQNKPNERRKWIGKTRKNRQRRETRENDWKERSEK